MKKKYILFILFVFIGSASFAQDAQFNLKKYWYLRWRLKNYFMVMGAGPGMSLPVGIRNSNWGTEFQPGDNPNKLGVYIGVLATEFKLLNDNNQNTTGTSEELYYALKAINRLDEFEGQYPWQPWNSPNLSLNHLDGRCSRGDYPPDFVSTLFHSELNQNLDFFNGQHGNPTNVNHGSSYSDITNSSSQSIDQPLDGMSQDHISSILAGLAFVQKFVPAGTIYNGMDLRYEARQITSRLLSYMQNCFFVLTDPTDNTYPEGRGSIAIPFAYGFGKAASFIDPSNSVSYMVGIPSSAHEIWDACGSSYLGLTNVSYLYGQGFCESANNFVDYIVHHPLPGQPHDIHHIPCDNTGNAWIMLYLAAIGDSWENVALDIANLNMAITHSPALYPLAAACNVPGISCTQGLIWAHSKVYGWESYYPLMHAVLHNTGCLTTETEIEADLNSISCYGPSTDNAGWATSDKFHAIQIQNQTGDPNPIFQGNFSGLECMLLFNMYCIHQNGDYVATADYINLMNAQALQEYPANTLMHYGSDATPAHAADYGTLTSSSIIHTGSNSYSNGNVTFRAGTTVDLQDGFEVEMGATFEAYIDPYTCDGTSYARKASGAADSIDDSKNNAKANFKKGIITENALVILPNPATEKVKLQYSITSQSKVNVRILNIFGEPVAIILQNEQRESGNYESVFDASALAPGVYFCVLETPDYKEVKKLVKINNQ